MSKNLKCKGLDIGVHTFSKGLLLVRGQQDRMEAAELKKLLLYVKSYIAFNIESTI